MGEPAGIAPEITAQAWAARQELGLPPFAILGDPELYAPYGPVHVVKTVAEAAEVFTDALPVLPLALTRPIIPRQPDAANSPVVINSIDRAVALCLDGQARAMVTNPIAKSVLYEAGFAAPGHTEYLAHLCGLHPAATVMMLVGGGLRVVPATIHIPLVDVPKTLTPALLHRVITTTMQDLIRRFRIPHPRLAVAGLNPHAGEAGTIGTEETDWIAPLCEALRREGLDIQGPCPADTLFHEEARKSYDAAIALYHDQALIPVKTLDFHGGVNVTLGLPIVRTSPDHGTAFDIAGMGQARADSLIAAIRLADQLS